ncbi:MAG: 50S ribosomal protein L5 [Candidatus Aenigmatarchaeota archaeon]
MNKMQEIKIDKITLNIGCGDDKAKIEKATKLLEMLTGKKSIVTKSKKRSTFGIPKGKPLGVMVTLRKADAFEFLKKALAGIENKLSKDKFDSSGNFSFGVREYIDMPGVKYSHEVGMMGFELAVTLYRAGFRIKKRRIQQRQIPVKHKISKEDAAEWAKKTFGVELIE